MLQPCYTFFDTYKYYNERVYDLQGEGHDYANWNAALAKAKEWNYGGEEAERIPIGIFYKAEKPTYEDLVLGGRRLHESPTLGIKAILQRSI